MKKLRYVPGFCKVCGRIAYLMTRRDPKKISKKELEYECNDCVWERWQKEGAKKQQALF